MSSQRELMALERLGLQEQAGAVEESKKKAHSEAKEAKANVKELEGKLEKTKKVGSRACEVDHSYFSALS